METTTGPTIAAEITEAARRREAEGDFPAGYAARVRAAAAAFALSEGGDAELHHAAAALEDAAVIDVDVPLGSARRSRRLVKLVIKKAVGWYLGFVGDQVSVLGRAAARLGEIVATRVERLERETEALRVETARLGAEVARLQERVAELEGGGA